MSHFNSRNEIKLTIVKKASLNMWIIIFSVSVHGFGIHTAIVKTSLLTCLYIIWLAFTRLQNIEGI